MRINILICFMLAIGCFLSFSSIVVYFFSQQKMKQNVHQNVVIRPGSKAFEFWKNPPAKIYRKYYFFDVINSKEVQNGLDKPFLIERGPYVYLEVWEKQNISFSGNELVTYSPTITLYFEESLSNGKENDRMTFLNVPAMAMIEMSTRSSLKELAPDAVNMILKFFQEDLFVTKTVNELMAGYSDPLLKIAKNYIPHLLPDGKFSLLKGRNGSVYQNFTMMTGNDFASNIGKLVKWNGKEKLSFWNSSFANSINGSDGTFYPPFITKDQTLYSFNSDMCRSYHLKYFEDNEIDGIKTYSFNLPLNMFYNSSIYPENQGFCDANCLGNGVLNISHCNENISAFLSLPHFLNADKKFIQDVYGLSPNKNMHDFLLDFEPTTGVPISGSIKLQISFFMTKNTKIDIVKSITPGILLPMFWFESNFKLDENTRIELKKVALIAKLTVVIPIILLTIGVFLFIAPFPIILYLHFKKKIFVGNSIAGSSVNSENSVTDQEQLIDS